MEEEGLVGRLLVREVKVELLKQEKEEGRYVGLLLLLWMFVKQAKIDERDLVFEVVRRKVEDFLKKKE